MVGPPRVRGRLQPGPAASDARTVDTRAEATSDDRSNPVATSVEGAAPCLRARRLSTAQVLPSHTAEIANVVQAVLGLDNRPQAEPHVAVPAIDPAVVSALTVQQVAQLYSFPTDVTGKG